MIHTLYNTALTVASPFVRRWLHNRLDYQPLLNRFDPPLPVFQEEPLWIQACSLGEINTLRPFIALLKEVRPDVPLLITTSTRTGMQQAESQLSSIAEVTWFPFDTSRTVQKFFRAANPRALVLFETEIWPNVLVEADRQHVPVIVINGRLSDRNFRNYVRFKWFFKPYFSRIQRACTQTEEYAQRFRTLGVAADRVSVAGSLKFDAVQTEADTRERARLRALHDFAADEQVLVFGSTRPGDEHLAAQCWKQLSPRFSRLRMVVVPRHVERAGEARVCFDQPVTLRSEMLAGRGKRGEKILVVDTSGELGKFYSVASIAIIGGSFYPGVGGHNPLESAALGIPTVFGPHMSNFKEPVAALLSAQGAVQVQDPAALAEALASLLQDAGECRRLGTRARMAVLKNQGAARRNLEVVLQCLPQPKASPGNQPP